MLYYMRYNIQWYIKITVSRKMFINIELELE